LSLNDILLIKNQTQASCLHQIKKNIRNAGEKVVLIVYTRLLTEPMHC